MNTVHQFHSGTAVGDAITNQMLRLNESLIAMGYSDSRIYAEYIPDELSASITNFEKYRGNAENILIVHHSMGITPKNFEKIKALPDKKILIYHNITPEKYFDHKGTVDAIRMGLRQVQEYSKCFDYFIACSNYNRRDLIHMGFDDRIDVLPVHISLDRFDHTDADAKVLEHCSNTVNILFVGRIVWNKRQIDLVKAFAVYHRCFNANSRLYLVGDAGIQGYVQELQALAEQLQISDAIEIPGKVSENELKAYYQSANVFFCMSEHEGFGVPLLEAMRMGVPVLAFRSSAVPETMDGAGIIANEKDYGMLGAMLDELVGNVELRDRVIERQNMRIRKIETMDSSGILKKAIENVQAGGRKMTVQLQGPFETSYSLAIVNRKLAEALDDQGKVEMSIYCTEGPGDYQPKEKDMADKPHAKALWQKSPLYPYPDVTIRNMYPPRVHDVKGGLNFQSFGWEESVVPSDYIENFNRYLDGIGTTSDYVTQQLIECGIKIPVRTMGNGVELSKHFAALKPYPLKTCKRTKFLHISSAFPRKGVDVLLQAFFEAFTDKDDVCLVLKTFPNPHNTVDEVLKTLREQYPKGPEVEWINQDLKQDRLESLYKAASCYVSVARGEGFGLPVAEAMLARLPVIVSPNTGMADFCNEETALLVGYDMVPAATHLTTGDALHVSLWAEPRKEDLKRQMLRFAQGIPKKEIQKMVSAAYALISKRFTWNAVADRWYRFIKDVERNQRLPKIGMVTTWNSKCGIAEYTRMEIEASERLADFKIYPNSGVELLRKDEDFVQKRVWQSVFDGDMDALTEMLEDSDREIIHFQFNFGFFKLRNLVRCIDRINKANKKVVITFHKTDDTDVGGTMVSLRKIAPGLNKCAAIVVHQQDDYDRLERFGVRKEILHIIPLGQLQYPVVTPSFAKSQLKLNSSMVIGSYGFLLPHKGIKEIIRAMPAILKEYPDAVYMPVCAQHESPESREYLLECQHEIEKLGLRDHVKMETRYLPNEESLRYLQACDLMCMAYKPSMESASGAIRFCLAAARPTVTTKQKIFEEFSGFTTQIEKCEPRLIAEAILDLACNQAKRDKYTAGMMEYIKKTRWYNTANAYRQLYLEVLM